MAEVTTPRFAVDRPRQPGISCHGHSWWLGDGLISALGFAGQRIDILHAERLAVVALGASPQPPHAAPEVKVVRRQDVAAFIAALHRTVGGM